MIHIKQADSVIEQTRKGNNIYKKSLRKNAEYKDWAIKKIKKYGSVENYFKQLESGEDYFNRIFGSN